MMKIIENNCRWGLAILCDKRIVATINNGKQPTTKG
jgi:hypothetical protein